MRPASLRLTLFSSAIWSALLPACGKSKQVSVETNPDILAAAKSPAGTKESASSCLDPKEVRAGKEYTCADGKKRKGTLVVGTSGKAVNLCSKDKEKGCVTSEDYLSFSKTELAKIVPGNVKQGVVIVGVSGSLSFSGPGECASDGELGCVSSSAFPAAAISGLAAKVISTASVAGETGTVVLPDSSDVRSGVAYGPAFASTGTFAPDFPDVANVRTNDTVAGVPGTLATCASDGAEGCVVPSGGTIKAAETANFTGWDIRKKRNSSGTVLTFAGIPSQGKSLCRNRANITDLGSGSWDGDPAPGAGDWNNTVLPATAGLDFFDTIDDGNNRPTSLPGDIPAWTMLIGGQIVTAGNDFSCGGIYATGSTADGNTGADATLAHDPNGNWQDITPNFAPGGQSSDNLGGGDGCNHADKHCVFRELISGLMVTEVSASSHTWQNAIDFCHTLGESGNPVVALRSPIPVIGATYTDWRLPTQKELMQMYNAGARGLNQTSNLTTFFGSVMTQFWSSSSVSWSASSAWAVGLHVGSAADTGKTNTRMAVCVR
ncbi:MAG: DUF1566 domain-containing protein [Silvanigrellales bacterium]|nr:DUF1566 domain-containing protein [Silvanigrellales bacterium]